MATKKPKTIKEAIDDLQEFLECDLYTKLRPEIKVKGETWGREDFLKNEEEFLKYMDIHFNILREQIKELKKLREFKP